MSWLNNKGKHFIKFNSNKNFKNPASKFSTLCFDWLETVIYAIIFIVILMTFVFKCMTVIGESMMNTLYNKDEIIIKKWHYTPENGDIIAISQGANLNKSIIKRIIAKEGQTLEIDFSTGTIIVNGEKINEPYIKEKTFQIGDSSIPKIIPQGYYFVMGDNRNHSTDSRFTEVGLIPRENVIGKAIFRFYPFNRIGFIN